MMILIFFRPSMLGIYTSIISTVVSKMCMYVSGACKEIFFFDGEISFNVDKASTHSVYIKGSSSDSFVLSGSMSTKVKSPF